MKLNKQPVLNRHGLKMLVHFEPSPQPNGKLAIIQHGYGGYMDELHLVSFAKTFLENGYNVLLTDSSNSMNEADGRIDDATIQTHYEDLQDIIQWTAQQDWHQEPFALLGHSLGGMSVLNYAINNPDKISVLIPAAAVINKELMDEAYQKNMPDDYQNLINGKTRLKVSEKYPDKNGHQTYHWFESMKDYDVLPNASNITSPTLLLVGEHDEPTPPEHQKILLESLSCEKEIHIFDKADHCYSDKIPEACAHLDAFLKKHA